MKKETLFGTEAREKIKAGVNLVAKAVAPTLGPKGRSAILGYGADYGSVVLDDGVSIAQFISAPDIFENEGVKLIKEVAGKTNDLVGDGPQPLYAKVLTPKGFVKMESLKVGDTICGTNGTVQEVIGVFPKGEKEIYEVEFRDGRVVECCKDHIWTVVNNTNEKRQDLTVSQMLERGVSVPCGNNVKYRFYAPVTYAEFETQPLPLDPYLVGVLLGDGCLKESGSVEISIGYNKEHILDNIVLPEGITMHIQNVDYRNSLRVKFQGTDPEGNDIRYYLEKIGLNGKGSFDKFIPKMYLYNSIYNRQELLRGLLHTDGYINSKGLIEFSTVSEQLANDFTELLRGLGRQTKISKHSRQNDPDSYSDNPIYRMYERQGRKHGVQIKDIRPTGKFTEMMCIKVSNDDQLYFTDNYIVTHNTSTSVVLSKAMLDLGIKNITAGANPTLLKKGMELGVGEVVKRLKDISTPVSTNKDVERVATISANNIEMGKKVAEAISKVGNKGIISVEEGSTKGIEVDIVSGMQIGSGYITPYFGAMSTTQQCVLHNPAVAIIDRRLQFANEVIPLLEFALQNNKSMLIICEDMTGVALQTVVTNYVQGKVNVCVIKAPSGGKNKKEILEDISIYTGAKIFGSDFGNDIKEWTPETLGQADRVTADEQYTVIRVSKKPAALSKRLEMIENELKVSKLPSRIEHLNLRKAGLTSGIALLKICSSTKTETEARMAKLEDAKNAALAALEEGVIPGGGTALVRCESAIDDYIEKNKKNLKDDVITGLKIVKEALGHPVCIIAENAGLSGEVTLDLVRKGKGNYGFNADTEKYEDLVKSGVIDATKVIKTALENASSVVSTVLMTECVSVIVSEDVKK